MKFYLQIIPRSIFKAYKSDHVVPLEAWLETGLLFARFFLLQIRSWKLRLRYIKDTHHIIPKGQLAMQTFFILLVALFPLFCIITYKIWSFCKQMSEFVEKPFNYIHDQFKHLTTKISSHF